jgi:hypothetical protein
MLPKSCRYDWKGYYIWCRHIWVGPFCPEPAVLGTKVVDEVMEEPEFTVLDLWNEEATIRGTTLYK